MPERVIEIPGVGNVAFPDTMDDAAVSAAAAKLYAETQKPAPAPGSKDAVIAKAKAGPRMPAAGRGTQLDLSKSNEFAAGLHSSIPFAGGETPSSAQGVAGRAVGEAAQWAVPVTKAVQLAGKLIPNATRAGQKFQQVMGAAKEVPIDIAAPGKVALRIQELAERGGSMPMSVRKLLNRMTDPEKGPLKYEEARDFYHNISRLSADEFKRLTPVVRREIGNLRVALNESIEGAAKSVGKLKDYRGAMKEYRQAAKVTQFAEDTGEALKRYAIPGGIAVYGMNKLSDLVRGR